MNLLARWSLPSLVAVIGVALCPGTAFSQQVQAHAGCGDVTKGAAIVGSIAIPPEQRGLAMVAIFASGSSVDTYMDGLRGTINVAQTTTAAELNAASASAMKVANVMPTLYSSARFARIDDQGTMICGNVPPGRYDVLIMITQPGAAQQMRYLHSKVTVPNVGERHVLEQTHFSDLRPS